VLVFPGGKGSTVGSYAILPAKENGVAPAAMINVKAEPIVCCLSDNFGYTAC